MRFFLLLFALILAAPTFAAPPTQALDAYLKKNDGFAWKKVRQNGQITTLSLTSQNWQGIKWQHQIRIYQPKKVLFPGRAVMQLTTEPFAWDDITGRVAANRLGVPFISVYDVPNQPLWGRNEDGLFGYSLQKMFENSDPSWSLAFPMAKSATRAMDAVQAYSKTAKTPISQFIMIGFSKRALAAWLAATDSRVMALVSVGYNNLNVGKQAPNQLAQWGEYSPQLRAYTRGGLIEKIYSPEGQKLIATWDPYSFRSRLAMPKYIIDATNNGYWTLDAFDLYADELKGQSNLLYVANAGHFMENAIPSVFGSAAAWCRAILEKKPISHVTLAKKNDEWVLDAKGASRAQLFYAFAATKDFRQTDFVPVAMQRDSKGVFKARIPAAPVLKPVVAVFGEGSWDASGMPLKLTSRVKIGRF